MYHTDITEKYALFVGEVTNLVDCKTATGISIWRPECSVCQVSLEGCTVDLGLPHAHSPEEAWNMGARAILVGINLGGTFVRDSWIQLLLKYAEYGFDIVNTLHVRLDHIPALVNACLEFESEILETRHIVQKFDLATGRKRPGLRLLTIGGDGIVGKKYTALALHRAYQQLDGSSTFRPTGQTGRIIAGPKARSIVVDSTPTDFVSGAAEWLTPDNEVDHWDIVEGQGGLMHPAWGVASLSLLYGTQPDFLVYCIDPARHKHDLTDIALVSIAEDVELNLTMAKRVNPHCRLVGFSINRVNCNDEEMQAVEQELNNLPSYYARLPRFDPSIASTGMDLVLQLMREWASIVRANAEAPK
jgi:uncharacterized NAD-dependent epimerase/dehydratase family protein